MMDHELTESNFMLYAAKHYDNPNCHDVLEFYDDLKRFKYLKKLFHRYKTTGELKDRLILNHIIVLNNMFGAQATANMMILKLNEYLSEVKPFLVMLNIMPEITEVNSTKYVNSDIGMDQTIVEALRKI
jgi:hypothetical protein